MILTDTHSHIYDTAFDDDREAVFERALLAGVTRILLPAIDSRSHDALFDLCRRHPQHCIPMMGLHPTSVNEIDDYRAELDRVERLLREPPAGRFCAVGEVGLDFYWSTERKTEQIEAFRRQIELALELRLPLAIHTRNAWDEMLTTLGDYAGQGLRGVMHAFSGTEAIYRQVKRCGDFLFGIGGVVTYKRSETAALLPCMSPDDLVLETDSPYLTPVPFRGKRNESAYVRFVCEKVAEIYGLAPDDIAERTTRNACRMFGS